MAKCAEKRPENPYRMSRIRAGFRNRLKDIAQDGYIDADEKERMEPVVSCMRRLKQKITAVQLQAASQIC